MMLTNLKNRPAIKSANMKTYSEFNFKLVDVLRTSVCETV